MKNGQQLPLPQCPHCEISHPVLQLVGQFNTMNCDAGNSRRWTTYSCTTCGGVVLTVLPLVNGAQPDITSTWPPSRAVADELPTRTREYLKQAITSRRAPSGAVVLAASAVDSMLKDQGYKEGTLYSRIDQAAEARLITVEMAAWAHEVRLDANDQRHADEAVPLPTEDEADKTIEFAEALGQFLYVLPAMVTRGRKPPTSVPQVAGSMAAASAPPR